jgi:hypothetical protein
MRLLGVVALLFWLTLVEISHSLQSDVSLRKLSSAIAFSEQFIGNHERLTSLIYHVAAPEERDMEFSITFCFSNALVNVSFALSESYADAQSTLIDVGRTSNVITRTIDARSNEYVFVNATMLPKSMVAFSISMRPAGDPHAAQLFAGNCGSERMQLIETPANEGSDGESVALMTITFAAAQRLNLPFGTNVTYSYCSSLSRQELETMDLNQRTIDSTGLCVDFAPTVMTTNNASLMHTLAKSQHELVHYVIVASAIVDSKPIHAVYVIGQYFETLRPLPAGIVFRRQRRQRKRRIELHPFVFFQVSNLGHQLL